MREKTIFPFTSPGWNDDSLALPDAMFPALWKIPSCVMGNEAVRSEEGEREKDPVDRTPESPPEVPHG